jgi:hypothetical protein
MIGMRNFQVLVLVLVITVLAVSGCNNKAAETSAKVISLNGTVEIRQNAGTQFVAAKINDTLGLGGIVKTGEESLANLEIAGKGTVEIKSDGYFELEAGRDYVTQNSGMAIYKIEKTGEGFKIKAPQGIACVLGTTFMVRVIDNMTVVGVETGKVSVTSNNGETRVLEAKQKINVGNSGFSGEVMPFDINTDSFNYIKIDGRWVPKE